MRGVLNCTKTPYSTLREFVIPYTTRGSIGTFAKSTLNLEDPPPSQGSDLPCPAALEFLAEIHEEVPKKDTIEHAVLVSSAFTRILISSDSL